VLDGYAQDEICSSGRGQLLLPWPNRIENGSYEFGGRTHQLPLDEPARRNAIHGLVRWAPWTITEHGSDRVTLDHLLHPRPGYPFALALRAEYALGEGGLSIRIEATNVGAEACPYGAGAHPYLAVASGRIDDETLEVPARTVLRADARGLPAGAERVEGTELDFRSGKPVGAVPLDHCFTDLEREGDGRVRVRLSGATTLWADDSFPYLMVFTGDGLPDVDRRSVAVEPMSCAPNAFRSGEGLIRLEPGETHAGAWGIEPNAAPAAD
jgi:aldose 1-epimerase